MVGSGTCAALKTCGTPWAWGEYRTILTVVFLFNHVALCLCQFGWGGLDILKLKYSHMRTSLWSKIDGPHPGFLGRRLGKLLSVGVSKGISWKWLKWMKVVSKDNLTPECIACVCRAEDARTSQRLPQITSSSWGASLGSKSSDGLWPLCHQVQVSKGKIRLTAPPGSTVRMWISADSFCHSYYPAIRNT